MRITSAAKQETRRRILDAAVEQFRSRGFSAATTRDIARQAHIASGTLFNYFPSKEAIVLALATESLATASEDFAKHKRPGASLAEDLFLYVSSGLRRIKRHRTYLHVFIQAALSPLVAGGNVGGIDVLRVQHLEGVQEILTDHEEPELSPVAAQLYWTLYLGILSYWARDRSPKQEDSLVLVDQSVSMFCEWLARTGSDQAQAE
jgi:AcrR family transcriptional regulator